MRTRRRLALLAVTVMHFGCASAPSHGPTQAGTPPCPQNEVVQVGGAHGVILAAGNASVDGYEHGAITRYWTPGLPEVLRAEEGVPGYLARMSSSLSGKFSSYIRQYTGFYHQGRKLIFIQFLCWPPSTPGWRCQRVAVDDGGDCYFSLEYDVASGEYRNLRINGEA